MTDLEDELDEDEVYLSNEGIYTSSMGGGFLWMKHKWIAMMDMSI
nr:hypothetical protein [Tanacetum cinerariifolium]